jgi:hypothetical protein
VAAGVVPAGEEATVVGSAAGLDPRDMVSSCRSLWKETCNRQHTSAATGLYTAVVSMRSQHVAVCTDCLPTAALLCDCDIACLLKGLLVCCLLPACWQVFSQYREHGVLLWRGFSFDDFANQVRA